MLSGWHRQKSYSGISSLSPSEGFSCVALVQINKKPCGQEVICLRGVAGSAVVVHDASNANTVISVNASAALLIHLFG